MAEPGYRWRVPAGLPVVHVNAVQCAFIIDIQLYAAHVVAARTSRMVVRIASPNCFSTLLLICRSISCVSSGRCVSSHPQTQGCLQRRAGLFSFFTCFSCGGLLTSCRVLAGVLKQVLQIMQRDCRDQRRDSREIVFRQQLTYPGSGYRHLLVTQPLNFNQFDGRCGDSRRFQPVAHILLYWAVTRQKGSVPTKR